MHRGRRSPRSPALRSRPGRARPSASRSNSSWTCHGATASRCSISFVCASFGSIAGRDAQVDARARFVRHRGRRPDDRRAVDAEDRGRRPGPQRVGDAVADHVDAVEHARVRAELLGGIRRARPFRGRVEPADRRRALVVPQGGEHADECRERVGGGAAEHPRVHGARERTHGDHDPRDPAQARRQGRHAHRDVARVADEDRVRAQQVGVLPHEGFETAGPLLLGALADDLHGHGRLGPERAQGSQVRGQASLAVGGAAPVPAAVPLRQLPGRRLPAFVGRGLNVVVEVEEDGRRARPAPGSGRRRPCSRRRSRRRGRPGRRRPRGRRSSTRPSARIPRARCRRRRT